MDSQPSEQIRPNTEADKPEVDQELEDFLEKLPQMSEDSIFGELRQVNHRLTESGASQEKRHKRIQSFAEKVLSYKKTDEGRNGEMAWEPGRDKVFRESLVQENLAPREFAPKSGSETLRSAINKARVSIANRLRPNSAKPK